MERQGDSGESPGDPPLDAFDDGMAEALRAITAVLEQAPETDECQILRRDLESCKQALERRHEAQLKSRRDRYSTLYELAPVGYATFDAVGRIREINLAAARIFDRSPSALIGRPFAELLTSGERTDFYEHLKQVFATTDEGAAEPVAVELGLERPEGTRELRLQSRFYRDGEVFNCLSVLTDVTEQRAAEQRGREDERLRQAMLNALPAHVAVLDSTGRIVAVNEAWQRFARANRASGELVRAVGLDYLRFCEGDGSAGNGADAAVARSACEGIRAVMRGDRPQFSLEYPCHEANRQRWFQMTVTPLADRQGGAVVAHLDVTERVEAEQINRRRRDEVAHASRLSSVGMLAGSLIHELSQPLTAANLYSEYLAVARRAETPDWTVMTEVMADLDAQIKRAVAIVEGLRGFLRSQEATSQLCDFGELLDQSIGLVRMLAQEKGIELRVRPPAESALVQGNPVQIVQVLVNLLCHVIDRSDAVAGDVRRVEIEAVPRDGRILVAVRDTGRCLSSPQSEGIFSVLDAGKESGLEMGLAVSRSLVEAHGGEFWADGSVSSGALVRFTLPLADEERGT